MMKAVKGILSFALFIWMVGVVVSAFSYEFDRKQLCVQQQGWFKGVLWCDTDSLTAVGQSLGHINNILKGMAWPYRKFMGDSNGQKGMNKEKFHASPLSTAYSCLALTKHLGVLPEVNFFSDAMTRTEKRHDVKPFALRYRSWGEEIIPYIQENAPGREVAYLEKVCKPMHQTLPAWLKKYNL
jgi:hypothetical protein